jgi:oxygen-independent coproporphyrinogen-3 oxidase
LRWIKAAWAGRAHYLTMNAELLAKYDRRIPRYTSYPTAPHFGPAVDAAVYSKWLRALPYGQRASLYLHVPFCAALCWYCGCHTRVVREHRPVADYADLLAREIALVADAAPPLAGEHVHWGGGTPNMLGADELKRLMDRLAPRFNLTAGAEVSMELDPRILTTTQVRGIAAAGITRASLGVQDFDAGVQQAINRFQPYEMTARAVAWLRDAGIAAINFDLMYGLPLQTVESVVASVEQAAALAPDRVALFGYAHVPWMKPHQRLLPEAALPGPEERWRQAEAAAARLTALGYVRVGLDHFARPEDALAKRLADGTLHRNFQGYTTDAAPVLLGFGVSAIGSLPGGYVQNTTDVTAYRRSIRGGTLTTARGVALSDEDRLRRDIIERLMCDLAVDLAAVGARHGRAPEAFRPELARLDPLVADGIARRDGWTVAVTEDGRPLARAVAAVFDAYLDAAPARHAQAV